MARTIIDPELEAIKAGDEVAFEAIITRYHGPLMRLAMAYVRDYGVAEDVVQETWLTCLRTLDRFEGRSSLKTWIFGILLNVARAR
ncbi:MAG: sigma factor, partial [Candidatus Dormiibacterota bacterium]